MAGRLAAADAAHAWAVALVLSALEVDGPSKPLSDALARHLDALGCSPRARLSMGVELVAEVSAEVSVLPDLSGRF